MLNLSERCLGKDKRTALVDRDLLVEELSAPANLADDRAPVHNDTAVN